MEKTCIQHFSEQEFIALAEKILLAEFPSTEALINAATEFLQISEHPAGTDLICYPEEFNISGAQSMVDIIKLWRADHGLPGFKCDAPSLSLR